jgi:transketolase
MATGMALSARQRKESHRVFCLLGDGETCEGSVWEAALTASSYGLGNLIAVIDRNKQMMTSFTEEVIKMNPYPDKWSAFGWNVIECDGHNMAELTAAVDRLPPSTADKPTAIICNTVKGKGVGFMERQIKWHAGTLSEADTEKALAELAAGRGK